MLFVFLTGCAFRQPSAVCPRLASVARLIWEIPRRSGIGQIPPELSGILDGFWYGPYIWSPYGHICFVPNIPLGELANAKEENWLVWPVKKTWKRAHLFGHPRTMELSLSLEIREIPALQVDGTSSRTSGSKETKLWSLEIRHDVTRWPNWLMKNLYWKNIPATLSVTHQRLIICCMPLKSCRFY